MANVDAVKVFSLVTEVVKTVRPAYAVKLIYIETSRGWVHGDSCDEIVTGTTPQQHLTRLNHGERYTNAMKPAAPSSTVPSPGSFRTSAVMDLTQKSFVP